MTPKGSHHPERATDQTDVKAMTRALAAPFEDGEVKWKPQAIKGNRALAVAYIDARVIQDRLDDVLGVEGWQDEYQLLPDNSVMCRLRLKLGKRWITKMDVGSPSEQPDGGDRLKAAFSDALKRAAVKFGIGRYLYRLPHQWCDFDSAKKQFVQTPKLPAFALPARPADAAPPRSPKVDNPVIVSDPVKSPRPAAERPRAPTSGKVARPANGGELHRRLREKDTELASQGLCPLGALLAQVAQAGVKAGFGADITQWSGPAIDLAVEETRKFIAGIPVSANARAVA